MAGRGRGRSKVAHSPDTPGCTTAAVERSIEDYLTDFFKLSRSQTNVKEFCYTLSQKIQKEEDVKELVGCLNNISLKDWSNANLASLVAMEFSLGKNVLSSFRDLYLTEVESLYKERNALIRRQDISKFQSVCALVCMNMLNLTDLQGKTLQLLVEPAFTCIIDLMEQGDRERVCAVKLLLHCGKIFYEADADKTNALVKRTRQIVVKFKGSDICRQECIKVIEAHASRWSNNG